MIYEDFKLILLTITKEDIEAFKFDEIMNTLNSFHKTPKKFFNKLGLMIDGYDNDSREIYEINEVRNYIQFLDKSFPYWFYYLNCEISKEVNSHRLLVSCICDIESITHNKTGIKIQINIDSLRYYVSTHFRFMNQLMEQENHSEKEIEQISKKILKLI